MTQLFNIVYVIFAVILLFGVAVFVHEFGHYWVARRRGMKVEEFAIGFGPKIHSWTRDGVVYSVRWIPAGGFVKLPQMITSEALEGKSDGEAPPPPASPVSKILVAFAGPLMNVIFAFIVATLIYFVGLPIPVNPPIVGYVDPKSDEAKLGIQEGDRIVRVNGEAIRSWEDVQAATILARTNVIQVVIEHAEKQTTYSLATVVSEAIGLKILNLDPRDHPVIKEVRPDSAALAAGLKVEDTILFFNKVPIGSREQLIDLIKARPGEPTEIVVKRGDNRLALNVTPRQDASTKKGFIGTQIGGSSTIIYQLQRPGPAPWTQIREVWDRTVSTISALIHSKETGVGAKDLSGPVGILAMLASQVNADYRLALSFFVLLSVNLAIINLLPLPVLDGGHICIAIIEAIRRRPIHPKILEYTTTAFAVLLISFMLYVTFFDIKRFPLFKALFTRGTQIENAETVTTPAPKPAPAQ